MNTQVDFNFKNQEHIHEIVNFEKRKVVVS